MKPLYNSTANIPQAWLIVSVRFFGLHSQISRGARIRLQNYAANVSHPGANALVRALEKNHQGKRFRFHSHRFRLPKKIHLILLIKPIEKIYCYHRPENVLFPNRSSPAGRGMLSTRFAISNTSCKQRNQIRFYRLTYSSRKRFLSTFHGGARDSHCLWAFPDFIKQIQDQRLKSDQDQQL